MKKLETSKLVLGAVLIFCAVMAVVVVVGWFTGLDDATGLLAAVCVPAGTVIGFYSWKAKNENMAKNGYDQTYAVGEESDRVIGFCTEEQEES